MSAPLLSGVHHIGICVRDLAATLAGYRARFGLDPITPVLEAAEIRGAVLAVGDDLLEIFEPRTLDGPLGRFLERRGEGLHHLAYTVPDLTAALATLSAQGARLVDTAPRPGLLPGWQVAFLHPSSAGGVLTELVQITTPLAGSAERAPGAGRSL